MPTILQECLYIVARYAHSTKRRSVSHNYQRKASGKLCKWTSVELRGEGRKNSYALTQYFRVKNLCRADTHSERLFSAFEVEEEKQLTSVWEKKVFSCSNGSLHENFIDFIFTSLQVKAAVRVRLSMLSDRLCWERDLPEWTDAFLWERNQSLPSCQQLLDRHSQGGSKWKTFLLLFFSFSRIMVVFVAFNHRIGMCLKSMEIRDKNTKCAQYYAATLQFMDHKLSLSWRQKKNSTKHFWWIKETRFDAVLVKWVVESWCVANCDKKKPTILDRFSTHVGGSVRWRIKSPSNLESSSLIE